MVITCDVNGLHQNNYNINDFVISCCLHDLMSEVSVRGRISVIFSFQMMTDARRVLKRGVIAEE